MLFRMLARFSLAEIQMLVESVFAQIIFVFAKTVHQNPFPRVKKMAALESNFIFLRTKSQFMALQWTQYGC